MTDKFNLIPEFNTFLRREKREREKREWIERMEQLYRRGVSMDSAFRENPIPAAFWPE